MLKGCKQEDMPPHIFSKAQVVYREMLNTRRDQSLVLMGKSGSGKTTNAQHLMHYLITAAGSVNGVFTSKWSGLQTPLKFMPLNTLEIQMS